MIDGQKVLCIDDQFPAFFKQLVKKLPKKGQIYTIRKVVLAYEDVKETRAMPCLLLRGLINKKSEEHGLEPSFSTFRFQALEDKEPECYERKRI